jgi:hypothetical protein
VLVIVEQAAIDEAAAQGFVSSIDLSPQEARAPPIYVAAASISAMQRAAV